MHIMLTYFCVLIQGLVLALSGLVSEGNTRFCVRHLYANFNNKFKGKVPKELMWAVA